MIAGAKKVTGAFHDFSPIEPDHVLMDLFTSRVTGLEWSKPRELPDWARAIFSENIVAAGNITDPQEVRRICELVLLNLRFYIDGIGDATPETYAHQQNRYCLHQRMNPHTPKVLKSLGYDDAMVDRFIKTCLFPYVDE